ncbi:hypothetical protein QE152_g5483 [Popillia japonica]|uniref:Uncharacterized protein n=1 Tax=Popillia japonica TaxID=7064 RepID=A0AAW1MM26_POPJA
MVSRALEQGASEVNIKSGFRAGIWAMDSDIFQDIDLLPSSTTDRPNPENTKVHSVATGEVVAEAEDNVEAIVTNRGLVTAIDEGSRNSSYSFTTLTSLSSSASLLTDI